MRILINGGCTGGPTSKMSLSEMPVEVSLKRQNLP